MHTFVQRQKTTAQTNPAKFAPSGHAHHDHSHKVWSLLHRQDSSRNQAAQQFQRAKAATPEASLASSADVYERQADQIAGQVMRMPEPGPQRGWARDDECPKCSNQDRQRQIQTQPVPKHEVGNSTVSPMVEKAIASPGQLLDPTTHEFMASRFGHSFSAVRVHTGPQADQATNVLQARAFTLGQDIVFAAGQYHPHGMEGRRILAHELTHVLQQDQHAQGRCIQRYPRNTPHGQPYTAGVMHNHRPTGRWSDIQAIESSNRWSSTIAFTCSTLPPTAVLAAAMEFELSGHYLAQIHLWHYLGGSGSDYTEDVRDLITRDTSVRAKLALAASRADRGHFKVYQNDYALEGNQLAFGAIDRLDYEVDRASGLVHVWFVDRYEFHPVYPGFYTAMPGDSARVTNCVHAAAVELKTSGASDFWMVGYGTIPLSTLSGPVPPPRSGSEL